MIDCALAAKFFQRYMDKELTAVELQHVGEHISKCSSCFGHVEFDRNLKKLLNQKSSRIVLSPELRKTIQKKLFNLS